MKRVLILGATGNGLFILNMVNQGYSSGYTEYKCVGFINDGINEYEGYPVLAGFNEMSAILKEEYYFFTALSVDGRSGRRQFYERLSIPVERFATFIHPSSFISENVDIGKGVFIGPNVSVNTKTIIEEGARIMPSVSIGSRCKIEKYAFVSVNSCIADNCEIGAGCHIGLSALISEGVSTGDSSLLGMGGFLKKSMGMNEVWVGNPARFLKERY
jgi:acetyltransferase EpsM